MDTALTQRRSNGRRRSRYTVQEALEDRAQLSRDLHDGVLQELYALALQLEACTRLIHHAPNEAASHLKDALTRVQGAVQEVRSYLRPDPQAGAQDPLELTQGLSLIVHKLTRGTGISCQTEIEPAAAQKVPADQIREVCHMTREAVSNAVRHGRPTTISLSLDLLPQGWRLEIWDNGVGFHPSRPRAGHGLTNLKARAAQLGGQLRITSAPSQGTRLVLTVRQMAWPSPRQMYA